VTIARTLALLGLAATPAVAQEPGWHYSPYPGEGDRAALGCAYESTPDIHTCIAVRCEDDFSIALFVDTGRLGGDGGRWRVEIDGFSYEVVASAEERGVYGARIVGDVSEIIAAIKNGGSLYLDPLEGAPPTRNGIGLAGSLHAINQALYFCAPDVPAEGEPHGVR
jgi:hypothetical protein